MKIEEHCTPRKNSLVELHNHIETSEELLKIVMNFCRREGKKQSTIISLVSAISFQLDHAFSHINKLMQELEMACRKNEILQGKEELMKKELDKTKGNFTRSFMKVVESEKERRRRAERLNEKLNSELRQAKTLLLRSSEELENERKSRKISEKVCSEMVKDIQQEKAEVEEMKRELEKALEEVEEERQMLQEAEEWREERVHMKLSEAQIQFEEKNAVVDQLRDELQAHLTEERIQISDRQWDFLESRDQEQLIHMQRTDSFESKKEEGNQDIGDHVKENVDYDSDDNYLNAIELITDCSNKGNVWSSYATTDKRKQEDLLSNYVDGGSLNFSGDVSVITDEQDLGIKLFKQEELIYQNESVMIHEHENLDSMKEITDKTPTTVYLSQSSAHPIRLRKKKLQASTYKGNQYGQGLKLAGMMKSIRDGESKAALLQSISTNDLRR